MQTCCAGDWHCDSHTVWTEVQTTDCASLICDLLNLISRQFGVNSEFGLFDFKSPAVCDLCFGARIGELSVNYSALILSKNSGVSLAKISSKSAKNWLKIGQNWPNREIFVSQPRQRDVMPKVKVKGATGIGAKGLRGSERSLRGRLWDGLREDPRRALRGLRAPLRVRFSSQSCGPCCPESCCPLNILQTQTLSYWLCHWDQTASQADRVQSRSAEREWHWRVAIASYGRVWSRDRPIRAGSALTLISRRHPSRVMWSFWPNFAPKMPKITFKTSTLGITWCDNF